MKKIAFIYSGSSEGGGLSTYLAQLFAGYDKKKLDIYLLSLGEWPASKKIEQAGGKVRYFSQRRISLKTIRELKKFVREEGVELLVTAGMISDFYGRKVSLLTKVPQISTVHSDWRFDYPNLARKIIFFILDRSLRPITKKYIVVSEYLRNQLAKSGVRPEKIEVVYNGVEFADIKKKPEKKFVIGSVGRLHKTKGFDILIKALKELPQEAVLIIWGEGSERRFLQRLIEKNGLSERVQLAGYVQNVEEKLSEIDIYVQPSRMEGFGLAAVEALGGGLPVVVTPAGSLPEVVKNEKTGYVSAAITPKALAERINYVFNNFEEAQETAEVGKKSVRELFSVSKWLNNLERIFLEKY